MTNFETWLNDADMPERQADGVWVDLETGLPYRPDWNYRTGTTRTPLSTKAQDARAIAKVFGGRALKGSRKQKEWAEKIRAQKLQKASHEGMTPDQAELACNPDGLGAHAHFWIEARDEAPRDIGVFFENQTAMLNRYRAAREAGDAELVAKLATEYNALTAKWGFGS